MSGLQPAGHISWWRDFQAGLRDLVFPQPGTCPVCDREAARDQRLCPECLGRLPFLAPPLCERCGRMLRLCAASDGSCRECAGERWYFSFSRSVCLYEGPARAYLHDIKYRRDGGLARALGWIMGEYALRCALIRRCQAIVPVPLHQLRLAERGFNQAEIMAEAVGASLRRPVFGQALARRKQTEAQSLLDREARRANVRGAFSVSCPGLLAGRRILLVDDILTTGYTASECARAILHAGALEVGVFTFANGVLDRDWHPQGKPVHGS